MSSINMPARYHTRNRNTKRFSSNDLNVYRGSRISSEVLFLRKRIRTEKKLPELKARLSLGTDTAARWQLAHVPMATAEFWEKLPPQFKHLTL